MGGGSQGLHARIDLLQMPTQALLPVIHAENQLRGGATVPVVPAPPALIVDEGVKDLVPVMILEGPQPDEAGGPLIQAIEALENEREPGWVKIPQGRARHPQMLGQPEEGPGAMKEVPTQPRRRGAPAPGPDELGQGVPMLGPGLFQRILPGSHQALGAAGQIFRQGPAEQGPAHQEFRGVVAEVLAQGPEVGRYLPLLGAEAPAVEALQDETHRQIVQHAHRLTPALIVRMAVAPQPDAGPAG